MTMIVVMKMMVMVVMVILVVLGMVILLVDWLLVVLGFNATLTAKVISWQSVTHMCFLAFSHQYLHNFSFQSHRLLFSHASADVRGENTPERKVASTGDRTHNHQVMSPTRSPLRLLVEMVERVIVLIRIEVIVMDVMKILQLQWYTL